MKKKVASKVLEVALLSSNDLGGLVRFLKTSCDDDLEYERFGKNIAKVVSCIHEEITKPLCSIYPDLDKEIQDKLNQES